MGNGSISSYRWQERPHSLPEQVRYWQSRAMQYKSERDQLVKTCERLALKLGQRERMLARCEHLFGFRVPEITELELQHNQEL